MMWPTPGVGLRAQGWQNACAARSAQARLSAGSFPECQGSPLPGLLVFRVWMTGARRRGHHYGTIPVDLEKMMWSTCCWTGGRDTLVAWLMQNPGIEIIARDRASSLSGWAF